MHAGQSVVEGKAVRRAKVALIAETVSFLKSVDYAMADSLQSIVLKSCHDKQYCHSVSGSSSSSSRRSNGGNNSGTSRKKLKRGLRQFHAMQGSKEPCAADLLQLAQLIRFKVLELVVNRTLLSFGRIDSVSAVDEHVH
jgi:hypothetical protein